MTEPMPLDVDVISVIAATRKARSNCVQTNEDVRRVHFLADQVLPLLAELRAARERPPVDEIVTAVRHLVASVEHEVRCGTRLLGSTTGAAEACRAALLAGRET